MRHQIVPVLPHAAIGAALGGLGGFAESQMSNEPLRQGIADLQAQPNKNLRDTVRLGQRQLRLGVGEWAAEHPGAAAAIGAFGGAVAGARHGPGIVEELRPAGGYLRDIGKNIKDTFSRSA